MQVTKSRSAPYLGWMRASALVVAVAVLAAAGGSGAAIRETAARSPICRTGLTTVERDPRGLLPLTGNAIARASTAALRGESARSKPLVVSATLATADRERGLEARYECGRRVWRRTVVVYITLRAFLPSASLAERVDFVGRFRDGYHVWQVVH